MTSGNPQATPSHQATFNSRWRRAVSEFGDRPFLDYEDPAGRVTSWCYQDWDRVVSRTAGFLASHGVGKGDRVHLALSNSPAFLAVWFASSRLGAVMIPSDPRATERELEVHITRTRPVLGVYCVDRAEVYEHAALASQLGNVVELSELGDGPASLVGDAVQDTNAVPAGDPAAVLFTSGTTSAPKGVVVTQANYAFAGDIMGREAGLGITSRFLVVLPMFHANAQYYATTAVVSYGGCVCLMAGFSASRFVQQAMTHRATHASLFAAPMRMILARAAQSARRLQLEHCWYAQNVSADQLDSFERLVGCRPRQLYGMTETIPAVCMQRVGDRAHDTIGTTTPGCDVDIRRPGEDVVAGPGEQGEITVGGIPGLSLFAGYLDDPEATSAAFLNDRFRTGDRAVSDREGAIRFVGRQGDTLKSGGENVSVVEVEEALMNHPSVLEAAVVGQPDPVLDEIPIAFVVRAEQARELGAEELLAYAERVLAPSKRPREVHFVDELPRTSVGKIRRFMLRAIASDTSQPRH
jgi:carnitine-CoA ligase